MREIALVVSGASGMILAARFATRAARSEHVSALHLVMTGPACKVISHELGSDWASGRGFCAGLALSAEERRKIRPWNDSDLMAPIASGSHLLAGTVVLPCSAGMAGALAHGISRGLAQRVADIALKQRWPLLVGIRETPMSAILLENLLRLARAGAHVVPPLPAYYLTPSSAQAFDVYIDHYTLRLFDLLGIPSAEPALRWSKPGPESS